MERTHFLIFVLVLVVSLYADEVECRRRIRTGGGYSGISGGTSAIIYGSIVGGVVGTIIIVLIIVWCVKRARRQSPSINARGIPIRNKPGQPHTAHGNHSVSKPYTATENPGFHGSQFSMSTDVNSQKVNGGNVVKGTPYTVHRY